MGKHTIVNKAMRIADGLWESVKDNEEVPFTEKRALLESFIKLAMLEAKFNPPTDDEGSFAEIIKEMNNGSPKTKRGKSTGDDAPAVNPFLPTDDKI